MNKNIKGFMNASLASTHFGSILVDLTLVYANQLSKFIKSRKNVYVIDIGDITKDIINCLLYIILEKVNKNETNTFSDKTQVNLLKRLYQSFQVFFFFIIFHK
jgi:hypothetical protein